MPEVNSGRKLINRFCHAQDWRDPEKCTRKRPRQSLNGHHCGTTCGKTSILGRVAHMTCNRLSILLCWQYLVGMRKDKCGSNSTLLNPLACELMATCFHCCVNILCSSPAGHPGVVQSMLQVVGLFYTRLLCSDFSDQSGLKTLLVFQALREVFFERFQRSLSRLAW